MYSRFSWIAWPVTAILEMLHHLFFVLVHFLATIFGWVLILIGLIFTGTLIGAVIGIPLICGGIYIRYHSHFYPL